MRPKVLLHIRDSSHLARNDTKRGPLRDARRGQPIGRLPSAEPAAPAGIIARKGKETWMGDRQRNIVPSQGGGMLRELGLRLKLILRLMRDSRVNPLLKLLPVGTLVYLVVPDLVIGPIDDAIVIWLGSVLFVELCPPDVVKEHTDALHSVVDAEWREADESSGPPPELPDPKA